MNTESDTPRTDALMADQGHKRTIYEHIQVMETHARQLERELAEMTKQRDALAEALESLCRAIISGEPREITGLLKQSGLALAAVKGGKP
jgi:hypothetical protein